jgi:hypothetical protein
MSGVASFRVPCGVAGRPYKKLGVGLATMACSSFFGRDGQRLGLQVVEVVVRVVGGDSRRELSRLRLSE